MTEEFGGDVLVRDTLDGPELCIVNGLVLPDGGFKTAVLLSLFGGNEDDTGSVINDNTWWGNKFEDISSSEKLVSKFANYIRTSPLNSKNIKIAEDKIKEDLQWFLDDGVADSVDCYIKMVEQCRIEVRVEISKSGEVIEDGNYGVQWEAMKNGI